MMGLLARFAPKDISLRGTDRFLDNSLCYRDSMIWWMFNVNVLTFEA